MSGIRDFWNEHVDKSTLPYEDCEFVEEIIRSYEEYCAKQGGEKLEVPCYGGKLVAQFFGDKGIYDGIAVDYVREDGKQTQCCVVETETDAGKNVVANPGELHVLSWNGNDEMPCHTQVIDKDGEYVY